MFNVLRRILFWSHLACGVVAGIVILIMCVTGVALTYQRSCNGGPTRGTTARRLRRARRA